MCHALPKMAVMDHNKVLFVFWQARSTKPGLDHVMETNSESDGDSGKGGSVNNVRLQATGLNMINGHNHGYVDLTGGSGGVTSSQPSPLVMSDPLSPNSVVGTTAATRLNAAAPVPYHVPGSTLGRSRPITCARDLAVHTNPDSGVLGSAAHTTGVYHTLYRSKTPVIYEHQTAASSSSLV